MPKGGSLSGAIGRAAARIGVSREEWERRTLFGEKWCWRCRRWMHYTLFGVDRTRGDWTRADCRECCCKASNERSVRRRGEPLKVADQRRDAKGLFVEETK